jgi:hypothetical protein
MSIIKKSDLKMHFANRKLKGIHPIHQVEKPKAAELSRIDTAVFNPNSDGFAGDFSLEHSSPGGSVMAVVMVTASGDIQASETPSIPQI